MKKSIIALAVAGVALTASAFAGGYAPAPQHSMTGAYVEGMVGAARRTNAPGINKHESATGQKNANWGWALGLDAGYQFNKALAAELGGFWVSKATESNANGNGTVTNWLGYLAGRLCVPLMDQINLFMKAGLGLNHESTSGNNNLKNNTGFSPVFGVGLAYNINPNLYVTGQYLYFGDSWNSWNPTANQRIHGQGAATNVAKTARVQLLTLGLGYKFQM